jgi:hypothetical protein
MFESKITCIRLVMGARYNGELHKWSMRVL